MSPRYKARYQDPQGRHHNGFPTYAWGCVPDGLATRRQLRERRLRPGADPVAQLCFDRYKATITAYLYQVADAKPIAPMTPGRWRTINAMLQVRSTCKGCGVTSDYCLPRSLGQLCLDCAAAEGLITC